MSDVETNIFEPKNGWLEYFLVSFWDPAYFQGLLLLVSGSVSKVAKWIFNPSGFFTLRIRSFLWGALKKKSSPGVPEKTVGIRHLKVLNKGSSGKTWLN